MPRHPTHYAERVNIEIFLGPNIDTIPYRMGLEAYHVRTFAYGAGTLRAAPEVELVCRQT